MINTYTVHQRTIEVEKLGTPINLWFFGDVHRDTEFTRRKVQNGSICLEYGSKNVNTITSVLKNNPKKG